MTESTTRRRFTGRTEALNKLCTTITDCHHSTPNWTESGKWVVRSENIKNGRISSMPASYTDEATFRERISRSVPEPGDLIVTREAPMGEVGMVPSGVDCCLGQRLVLIKPDHTKVDKQFLLYAMQSEFVQRQIGASNATGSTVSNLRIPLLKELRIPLLKDQGDIGAALGALDAKIELNNRINGELESLAKSIYDYWFVQFDFPNANGRPYQSSGGAMVWNDALKRKIPKGWGADNIGVVAEVCGGGTPSKSNRDFWSGDIPFFSPADAADAMFQLDTTDHITQQGLDACSSNLFPKGTVFITARGSVGKVLVAGRRMAMNQSCYALRPRVDSYLPFLYFHARTLVHHLKVKASGSTFNSIVTNDIEWTALAVPPATTIEEYGLRVRPLFDRIEAGLCENLALTRLRDWLLPLLMNGQVRVA